MAIRSRTALLAAGAVLLLGSGARVVASPDDRATAPVVGSVVERTVFLMGTRADLRVTAEDRAAALAASERAVRTLEETAERLSTWGDPGSGGPAGELARLNRAPVGEPMTLSPRLADELRRADACRRATGGAFDPVVGTLVAAWGLRGEGRVPAPEEIDRALESDGSDLELVDTPSGVAAIRRSAGVALDEGAWGKGAGLDAALAVLAADPTVLAADLDLGGQVAVLRRQGGGGVAATSGTPGRADGPAIVDLADPRERDRVVARIEIPSGSVATSGNSERGLEVDGRRIGHLLDPRTGRPAPDFGSLTVWAPTALEADCLATGLYVLGPDAALAWAEAHPGIEVIVARMTDEGGVTLEATPAIEPKLEILFGRERDRDVIGRRSDDVSPPADDAGMKTGAGAGWSVVSEVPSPCSPEDRKSRVGARNHEPRADCRPRS